MHKKEQSANVLEKSIKLKIVKRRKCLLLVFTNHFFICSYPECLSTILTVNNHLWFNSGIYSKHELKVVDDDIYW